jgi:hypothetical protein
VTTATVTVECASTPVLTAPINAEQQAKRPPVPTHIAAEETHKAQGHSFDWPRNTEGAPPAARTPLQAPATVTLARQLSAERAQIVRAQLAAGRQHGDLESPLRELPGCQVVEIIIDGDSPAAGQRVEHVTWPAKSTPVSVLRGGRLYAASPAVVPRPGDRVSLLVPAPPRQAYRLARHYIDSSSCWPMDMDSWSGWPMDMDSWSGWPMDMDSSCDMFVPFLCLICVLVRHAGHSLSRLPG